MALQAGPRPLIGKVDDMIYYLNKGKPCARRMPLEVRQTANTKQAAGRFGLASRTGKLIRNAFAPHLERRYDGGWVNRLNKRLLTSGVQGIKDYRFNQEKCIPYFLQTAGLGDNNKVRIKHFFKPRDQKITHMEIKLFALRIDLSSGRVINSVSHSHMHDLKKPFEGIEFDAAVPGKGTLLVALQVHPYQDEYPLHDKKFMATDLIAVEVAPAQTVSKKQRKQKQRLQQANLLQATISQQPLSDHSSAAHAIAGNLSISKSRLREQRE